MKFKFDENLPSDLGALLRRDGHDAHSVLDEDLRGAADPSTAKVCQDEQRILITLDWCSPLFRAYSHSFRQNPLNTGSGLWTTAGHGSERDQRVIDRPLTWRVALPRSWQATVVEQAWQTGGRGAGGEGMRMAFAGSGAVDSRKGRARADLRVGMDFLRRVCSEWDRRRCAFATERAAESGFVRRNNGVMSASFRIHLNEPLGGPS